MIPLALRSPLTPRQEQILQMLADGLSQKEIGYRLGIAYQTVKNHIYADNRTAGHRGICARIGKRTMTGAVAEAMRNMWIV